MWLAESASLWFSQAHTTLLFHLAPHRCLVLSPSSRTMMRWEHAVSLFTKMTANLTFNCPSAAYMNSDCLSFCLPACHSPLSISNIKRLSSPGASLLLILSSSSSFILSSNHSSQSSTAIGDVSFNYASSSAYFSSLYPLCSYLSSFPHPSCLFQVNTVATSDLEMCQFVWTGNNSFSLTHVSSDHTMAFILISRLSHPPCMLFCLLSCLFNVAPSSLCPRSWSSSSSLTLEN